MIDAVQPVEIPIRLHEGPRGQWALFHPVGTILFHPGDADGMGAAAFSEYEQSGEGVGQDVDVSHTTLLAAPGNNPN